MPTYPCTTFATLQVNFSTPEVPPANGYIVKWRPVGTTTWNHVFQNQNPIVITGVPSCFDIEGTIQADCGDGNLGNIVVFAASSSLLESACKTIQLLQTATYTYIACNDTEPTVVNNVASSPTSICALEGSVSGGTFTDLNLGCAS